MLDCLFCKIIERKIPSHITYEDEKVVAFKDVNPQAPIHQLIVPRKHIATINDINANDKEILGHMVLVAQKIAKQEQINDSGYRLIFNCNNDGGQMVYHLHLHMLGGRSMTWPPG